MKAGLRRVDFDLSVGTRGWEGATLQEGSGVYQATLHARGDGFCRILKTAIFMK